MLKTPDSSRVITIDMLGLILLVAAFVMFFLAAIWPFWNGPEPHRFSLVAAGLASWVLSLLLAGHALT